MSDKANEFLEHHGVKGQRWGIRNDKGHEGQKAKTKKIAKLDARYAGKVTDAPEATGPQMALHINLHNEAAYLTNKHDVSRINNKPEYKNADFTNDSPLRRKYYKEHGDAFINNLNKAAKDLGPNASGTKEYTIVGDKKDPFAWKIELKDVTHANNLAGFTLSLNVNDLGFVTGVEVKEDSNNVIEHHGVKGQRWGVRNGVGTPTKKESKEIAKRKKLVKKRRSLSDAELKAAIDRIQNEKKLKELVEADVAPGKTVAKKIVSESGQKVAKTVLTGAALYATKSIVSKHFDRAELGSYLAKGGAGKK